MKVYGTYPSHFTRKVRIVLQELRIPYEFSILTNLMAVGEEHFANNPLHQLPILEDGTRKLVESDLICEYLLEKYGHGEMSVYPEGDIVEHKQRLAIMNGGMDSGVKIIRGQRNGISNEYPFFQQERAALRSALRWLDMDLGNKLFYGPQKTLSLLELNLFCFLEWALFREMVETFDPYPNLKNFLAPHKNRPSFVRTHPSITEGI